MLLEVFFWVPSFFLIVKKGWSGVFVDFESGEVKCPVSKGSRREGSFLLTLFILADYSTVTTK